MRPKIYSCPICGLKYKKKKWVQKCERWCEKYKSCNLELIKHAINYGKNRTEN